MTSTALFVLGVTLALCACQGRATFPPPVTGEEQDESSQPPGGEESGPGDPNLDPAPGAWGVSWTKVIDRLPTYVWENNLAYDPAARRVVQHGGHIIGYYAQSSYTYTYDVETQAFDLSLAPTRPQRRCLTDLTYIESNGRVLTGNGGSSHGSLPQGRLASDWRTITKGDPRGPWLYDVSRDEWEDTRVRGSEWERTPHNQITYDPIHDAAVYLTPSSVGLYCPRTNSMHYRALPEVLKERRAYGIAADRRAGVVVLQGGMNPRLTGYDANTFNDTWTYDVGTNTWTELSTEVRPPKGTPRSDFLKLNFLFHPPTRSFLLWIVPTDQAIAAFADWPAPELWSFSLAANTWGKIEQTGTGPVFPGIWTYAEAEDRLVLVGGGRDSSSGRPATSRQLWTGQVVYPSSTRASPPLDTVLRATTSAASAAVALAWESTGLGSVDVYRAVANPFPGAFTRLATTSAQAYLDTTAEAQTVYAYRLTRADAPLSSGTTTVFTQPYRPGGLTASVESATRVVLNWSANSEGDLSGYNVYRASASGTVKLTATPVAATSYTDTSVDLADGLLRTYRVTAVNVGGIESGTSPFAATAPEAPRWLKATLVSNGTAARVEWTPPKDSLVSRYVVYMNDHLENTLDYSQAEIDAWWAQWQSVTDEPITTSHVDVPLPDPSKDYLFYVRAVNALEQQGFFTDIVSATDPRFFSAAP